MLFSGCSKSLKNMCSVRQRPMPSAPISTSLCGIVRGVGIGAHAEATNSIGPFHQRVIGMRKLRHYKCYLTFEDRSVVAIEGDPIPLLNCLTLHAHLFVFVIDVEGFASDDAALAPASCNNRRVTGLAAGRGENSLRNEHAANVFGTGFAAHKNYLFAVARPILRFMRSEDGATRCRARYGVDSFGELSLGQDRRAECRCQSRDKTIARCLRTSCAQSLHHA